jgi:type I restriction enzyme S subunit
VLCVPYILTQFETNVSIVDILGTIDDKIEANEKIGEKLRELGLMTFDKIQATATREVALSAVFKFFNGYAFKSQEYAPNGEFSVITIKNISSNGFTANGADCIEFQPPFSNFLLSIGDILLTMTGEVGRVGIVDREKCLLNQRVLRIEGASPFLTYFYFLRNEKQIKVLAKGSVQQNLGIKELSSFKIHIAPMSEYQNNDWIIEKLLALSVENQRLVKIKQQYLRKFF